MENLKIERQKCVSKGEEEDSLYPHRKNHLFYIDKSALISSSPKNSFLIQCSMFPQNSTKKKLKELNCQIKLGCRLVHFANQQRVARFPTKIMHLRTGLSC